MISVEQEDAKKQKEQPGDFAFSIETLNESRMKIFQYFSRVF